MVQNAFPSLLSETGGQRRPLGAGRQPEGELTEHADLLLIGPLSTRGTTGTRAASIEEEQSSIEPGIPGRDVFLVDAPHPAVIFA